MIKKQRINQSNASKLPGFWPMLGHTLNLIENKVMFGLDLTYLRIRCEIPGNLPAFLVRYTSRYVRIEQIHRSNSKGDT